MLKNIFIVIYDIKKKLYAKKIYRKVTSTKLEFKTQPKSLLNSLSFLGLKQIKQNYIWFTVVLKHSKFLCWKNDSSLFHSYRFSCLYFWQVKRFHILLFSFFAKQEWLVKGARKKMFPFWNLISLSLTQKEILLAVSLYLDL